MSVGSEATNQQGVDDSSNDALVIVDDAHSGFPPGQSPPPPLPYMSLTETQPWYKLKMLFLMPFN